MAASTIATYSAMTRLCTLLAMLSCMLCLQASPAFEPAKRYHIVCQQWAGGCVTDGALAGQSTPLYHTTTATTADESYWVLTEEQQGMFSIRNAKTGRYVTYDGVRDTYRRYLSLTSTIDGDNSLWTIYQPFADGNVWAIRNVGQQDHVWDVRSDSRMVGTYSRPGQQNITAIESFYFFDEQGHAVVGRPATAEVAADPMARAVASLTIGGRKPVYVKSLGSYLCPMPAQLFGTDVKAVVDYQPHDGYGTLTINGQPVAPGDSYSFGQVANQRAYGLSIAHANGTTVGLSLTFTALPVVKLYGTFGNAYSQGIISVTEPDDGQPQQFDMRAKWRGGITNNPDKHKRNYHVKLLDSQGEKLDHKFLGLRNDNSWILESCQVDMLRIRNRTLTDLWNDFCSPPYYADQEPKALSGSRGQFVELVLNDEYYGLYCMTEAMDRKQMKLKKYDEETKQIHGLLWKSKDWSYAVFMGHNRDNAYYPGTSPARYNNSSESWDQFYVKYPDIEEVNPTNWQPLYNAVNFVCTASDASFASRVAYYFDMPVLIDYYVLMETILATDNHGKNMYFAVYDQEQSPMITLGVWDMDATCGQRWSDGYWHQALMKPEQDYATYITNNEHGDYNLFRRLRNTNAGDFNMKVRLRYRDLRQGVLATDSLLGRFRRQVAALKACGAAQRESARWSGDSDVARHKIDFDEELAYLEDWITRRLNYLDTHRFDIASLPSAVSAPLADNSSRADGFVYDIQGRRLATNDRIDQLPAGVYIVGGRKFVKR